MTSAAVDPTGWRLLPLTASLAAQLVGYRCFGPEGRVPGGRYDDTALDTGGGLRPDLTGHGLGRAAILRGIEHAQAAFHPLALRVTVWQDNHRALRVIRSLGFEQVDRFVAATTQEDFVVLTLPLRPPDGVRG